MRKTGFTLIELLVVIAIIAILAAILFPVFLTAKERANQGKCLSNLRQIATAGQQYVSDNGDRMPMSWEEIGLPSWQHYFQPYMKNRKMLICVADKKALGTQGATSYKINQWACTYPSSAGGWKSLVVQVPTRCWWFTDGVPQAGSYGGQMIDCTIFLSPYWWPVATAPRHNNGYNVVYVDGHANWRKEMKAPALVRANDYRVFTQAEKLFAWGGGLRPRD